jgi:ABC-type nitrate/sulfonate/bicarbonate transport system permease component
MRRFAWVLVLAVLLAAWEAYVQLRGVPEYLLPAPSQIAQALWDDRSTLASQALVTLKEMLLGFAAAVIIGFAAAVLLHLVPWLRGAVQPILIASQSVPVVAIAPILVIYLGFGLAPKVLIVALVCFFPITVNTLDGLERVDPEYRRMLRTLDATRWQVFRRVELPWSLPGLFAGARIAASYSAVAAVFAEYAGGQSGLVDSMRDGFDTPLVGAAIVVLALMSLALYGAVTVAERLTLPWARGR